MDRDIVDPRLVRLLEEAASRGAEKALVRAGLHDEKALADLAELRTLLDSWRQVKRGALKQLGQILVWIILILILLALGMREQLTPPTG